MKKRHLVTGIASGLVAGAAASLLLTPKSGKEIRKEAKKQWNKWQEKRQTAPYQEVEVAQTEPQVSNDDIKVSVVTNESNK